MKPQPESGKESAKGGRDSDREGEWQVPDPPHGRTREEYAVNVTNGYSDIQNWIPDVPFLPYAQAYSSATASCGQSFEFPNVESRHQAQPTALFGQFDPQSSLQEPNQCSIQVQARDWKNEPFMYRPADGIPHPSSVFPDYLQGKLHQPAYAHRGTHLPPVKVGNVAYRTRPALDLKSGDEKYLPSFMEKNGRTGFIWKVLLLVFAQLFVTIVVSITAMSIIPVKEWLESNKWVFWASWISAMVVLVLGLCMYDLLRQHPNNLVFLFVFTCLISVMTATIIVRCQVEILATALAFAAILVVALILVAGCGKFDITICAGVLSAMLMVFVLGIAVSIFWVHSIFEIALSGAGSVIFALYIVMDLQRMMGNKKVSIEPTEHVLGAITLYMDILAFFMYLFSLLTFSKCR